MDKDRLLEELYSSNFTVFLGNFGLGKSISQTYLGIMSAMLNKRKVIMSNTPIYNLSSYGLEFIPLISTSQFTENMKNVEIIMDELHKIADSRKSLSPENSFVTEFSTDVRKFNQGIVATSQFNNTYDVRLVNNTEINIVPEWKIPGKKDRIDFNSIWNIYFLSNYETESLTLNLDSIKNMYNTNFKPLKLICNHRDYIDNLEDRRTEKYMDKYHMNTDKALRISREIFKDEMKGKE